MKKVQIKVSIADDHDLIREGLKRIVSFEDNMVIVGEADNGKAVSEMIEKCKPDVLLLDMNMPELDGLSVLKQLRQSQKDLRTIILTVENNRTIIREAIKIGVDGYILKDSAGEQIIEAINTVFSGQKYIDKSLVSLLFENIKDSGKNESTVLDQLTRREVEVLYYMSKGLSNKEIGETLFLSEKTIKNYVTSLFRKLNIDDRVHATLLALQEDVDEYLHTKYHGNN